MGWLNEILATISGIEITGWRIFLLIGYMMVGFIISRIYWYWQSRGFVKEVAENKKEFLKTKGVAGCAIPAILKMEWAEHCGQRFEARERELEKPKTWLCMFAWPLAVPALILYYAAIWPFFKILDCFENLDKWLREKAFTGLNRELPTEGERENYEKRLGQDELKKLQKDYPDKPGMDKTIGPKKT